MTAAVYDPRASELSEGPFWHPERAQFFWFSILEGKLLSRDGDTPLEWSFGEFASAAGWIDRDTLLIATETGLRRFSIETGAHEPIIGIEADQPGTRSNDGRADPFGGFWIGTMGKSAEPKAGAIYRYYEGRVEKLFADITVPNSICFSPDGRIAYFTDSRTRRILRHELDAQGWPVGRPDLFADLTGEVGSPDGSVTDAEGYLWNAQWGAARVARYTPEGVFDLEIGVGGLRSSCPCFGGPDLKTLYVTTAYEGMAKPKKKDGLVYVTETAFQGRAEPRVRV